MEATGSGMLEFCNWLGQKGEMNQNTAIGMRVACSNVLASLEGWESMDIHAMDAKDVLRRFQNLNATRFTPGVMRTYIQRFEKALSLFKGYLSSLKAGGGWNPPTSTRFRQRAARPTSGGEPEAQTALREEATKPTETGGLINYPFPVRPGVVAQLRLPGDLSPGELRRLTTFLGALAVNSDEAPDSEPTR